MVTIPYRVLLFLLGAVIAGAIAAYFTGTLSPAGSEQAETTASDSNEKIAGPSTELGIGSDEEGTPGEQPESDNFLASSEQGEEADNELQVPTFHILRAEPDGSLVIAGEAEPGAEIEILSGSAVLATTQADPIGDFATILDEPLKPGDHNIVLRATSSNTVATSMETAIVSIPSAGSQEVVALVQQPGEPSRLISVPDIRSKDEPAPSEGPDTAVAEPFEQSAGNDGSTIAEGEALAELDEPGEGTPFAGEESAGSSAGTEEASQDLQEADPTSPPADEPSIPPADEPSIAQREPLENGLEDAGSSRAKIRNEDSTQNIAESTFDEGEAQQPVNAAQDDSSSNEVEEGEAGVVARVEPEGDEKTSPAVSDDVPFIEAVEIDGREIFVAGRAQVGRLLRVYANDILLGQTRASPDGRFLIEAERELPVGDYIIRADMLADDGVTVIARAAVPFERPAGEQIAAVAPQAMETGQESTARQGSSSAEGENSGREGTETLSTDAGSQAKSANQSAPGLSETAAGSTAPSASLRMEKGEEHAAFSSNPAQEARENETEEVMLPPLQPVDGAVIIRRGDTLWQISRRIYGRGIRYTTIYFANQDQIRDPHWIWPGQIFTVPSETDEGVKADLEAVGDQALPPDEAASVAEGE